MTISIFEKHIFMVTCYGQEEIDLKKWLSKNIVGCSIVQQNFKDSDSRTNQQAKYFNYFRISFVTSSDKEKFLLNYKKIMPSFKPGIFAKPARICRQFPERLNITNPLFHEIKNWFHINTDYVIKEEYIDCGFFRSLDELNLFRLIFGDRCVLTMNKSDWEFLNL